MNTSMPVPACTVLMPTWQRPAELVRCLNALNGQTLPVGQIVVTVRRDDQATRTALDEWSTAGCARAALEIVWTEAVPLNVAMNAGLARTTGDFVALTDDDAEPRADWLERCAAALADPTVGGVGGRDWQANETAERLHVGGVSRVGRVIGNHHLGIGPARDVELLKGVNCCFRGDLLRRIGFDRRLRGRGNVSHWEMALCFAVRRAGYRLRYDPAIGVDHHVAVRHDGDTNARGTFEGRSFADAVHNETLALLEFLPPWRCAAFLIWAAAVGTGEAPGFVQVARLLMHRRPHVMARWRATISGRVAGIRTWVAPAKPAFTADATDREPAPINQGGRL